MKLSARSFVLPAGRSRIVGVRLARVPASRSVYGSVEVIGDPLRRPRRGLAVRYRLIGTLRLDPRPSARRFGLVVRQIRAAGSRSARRLSVPVRNRGNTASAISGSLRLVGAGGVLRSRIAGARILPGRTVNLRLFAARLPAGRYTARILLRQEGRRVARVIRRVTVR